MRRQGSTKVFKSRPGHRQSTRRSSNNIPSSGDAATSQSLNVTVHPNSALFLLPDPVTCFRSAAYNQIQRFHLSSTSSAIILDWLTSGRQSLGERWAFARYYSVNEVLMDGKRIARDVMLLDDQEADARPLLPRKLADRMEPYSCYATLLLLGPLVQDVIADLRFQYERITVFKQGARDDLLWSMSSMAGGGAVVRVAGKETEDVKKWLRSALGGIENLVGSDVYRRAFA